MIFGKSKLELKVGLFVFIGLCVLVLFVLSIGKFRTWSSGYKVDFVFHFVNGLKLGAPVRFAGLDVGEIKSLTINNDPTDPQTQVHLECWLKNEVRIPKDSKIWINTLGLLGEKYVEIIPGKDYANCLLANASLFGVDPMPMHEVFNIAKGVIDHADQMVMQMNSGQGTIGRLLYDERLYTNLEASTKNLELMTDDLKRHPWKLLFREKETK